MTKEVEELIKALRTCNNPKGHRCSECPVFSRYEHRRCKSTVDRLSADALESLSARLAESQRRERAAVEDLKYYLENNEENGVVYVPKFAVEKLINRHGSQEAGKGAT